MNHSPIATAEPSARPTKKPKLGWLRKMPINVPAKRPSAIMAPAARGAGGFLSVIERLCHASTVKASRRTGATLEKALMMRQLTHVRRITVTMLSLKSLAR